MKKLLLLISFAFFLFITGFPQSLSLSWTEGAIPHNGEIIVLHEPPFSETMVAHISVTNNGNDSISIKVRKIEVQILDQTINSFCWGNSCYGPGTYESTDSVKLGPGQTDSTHFSGDYTSNSGALGTSKIWYIFFDKNNPIDSTGVLVNYTIGYSGVNDALLKKVQLSEAYPNPAANFTTFNYDLPEGLNNVTLIIRNILGSKVKEIDLTDRQGKLVVNTSGMKEGIYLYSLAAGQQTLLTRKLIINR
jgi:hypothetical protein